MLSEQPQATSVFQSLRPALVEQEANKEQAPALEREPKISRDSILVVAKRSRFERDQKELGLSEEALLRWYAEMGESGSRVLGSHERQLQAIASCQRELESEQIVHIEQLEERLATGSVKAIVALGGDDFLKLVSQHIEDLPVLGVNSDPATSTGVLLSTSIEKLPEAIQALETDSYKIERWTRVELTIDGTSCGRALNDVVLGKRDFRHMSRHELEVHGEKTQQRSSGILISTGAGSTGWFSSAGLYLGGKDRSFSREAPYIRFELREPQVKVYESNGHRIVELPPHVEGTLVAGDCLRITSLNDDEGIASRDSLDELPFRRGAVAELSVSSHPLRVIIPQETL
ncbi:MAG: hypothetical protein ACK5Y6_00990 [Pseudomonadota bacterium]|jgi:NAD+ kinase